MIRIFTMLLLSLFSTIACSGEARQIRSEKHNFNVVTLVEGLENPWSIAWLPDGRMLVTERPGRLRIVSKDFKLDPKPIDGLPPIVVDGAGRALRRRAAPRTTRTNGWIYISYNGPGDGGHGTELMRAKLDGHRLVDQQVLFRLQPKIERRPALRRPHRVRRQGPRLSHARRPRRQERAQRLDDHAGSVIRLNDDGSVPKDNPFVDRKDAKPEKFTLGNRNMQGAALHPKTGELWTHEHGPQGGDEVNVMRAGRNYGWPVITYGANYGTGTKIGEGTRKPGMEHPLHYWVPSIAPSGMAFYEGDRFPNWRGNLLVGALKDELLVRLELDGEKVVKEERLMRGAIGRIRDVRVGPDGYVYLLTDERRGVLARLEPVK